MDNKTAGIKKILINKTIKLGLKKIQKQPLNFLTNFRILF